MANTLPRMSNYTQMATTCAEYVSICTTGAYYTATVRLEPRSEQNPIRSYEWIQAECEKAERLANKKAVLIIVGVAVLLSALWLLVEGVL